MSPFYSVVYQILPVAVGERQCPELPKRAVPAPHQDGSMSRPPPFFVMVSLNGEELTWVSRIHGYGHHKDIIWSSHHMVQSRQNVPEMKSRKEISQIKR
jgi:hypothetical protein